MSAQAGLPVPSGLSASAWLRTDDNWYGHGRKPFGSCARAGCPEAACFDIRGERLCLDHKPSHVKFAPFLGQQTKGFATMARWVLLGGGAGPGKSHIGARAWLKQHAGEHERIRRGEIKRSKGRWLFVRRTFDELEEVITEFVIDFSGEGNMGEYRDKGKTWTCATCGYQVLFASCHDDKDWMRFYGKSYTGVSLDEGCHFTVKQIEEIDGRIRTTDPVLGRMLQLYILTNAVGNAETKQYLKERYVKAAPPETKVLVEKRLTDGRVITDYQVYTPSNVLDNPALTRDGRYEANLRRKSKQQIAVLLYNDWDAEEGAWVGDAWDREKHVVMPFPIPASWEKSKALDYGWNPGLTAVHWYAHGPSGEAVCYRAISFRKLTAKQVAYRVKEIESKELWVRDRTGRQYKIVDKEWDDVNDVSLVPGVADRQLWARDNEQAERETRGEIMNSVGLRLRPCHKSATSREDGAEQIRNRLITDVPHHAIDGEWVSMLRFFAKTTESQIMMDDGRVVTTGPTHTLPELPADEKNPAVPDTNANDHDWDTCSYHCNSRPVAGGREEQTVSDPYDWGWRVVDQPKQGITW